MPVRTDDEVDKGKIRQIKSYIPSLDSASSNSRTFICVLAASRCNGEDGLVLFSCSFEKHILYSTFLPPHVPVNITPYF